MKIPEYAHLIFLAKQSIETKGDCSSIIPIGKKFFGYLPIRIAVMAVALWHLAIHLLGFTLFVTAYYLMPDYCAISSYGIKMPSMSLNSKIHAPDTPVFERKELSASYNASLWFWMSFLSLCSTLLLLYGVKKQKFNFILPFLLLQLFDILFDFFLFASYIFLSSNTEEFFALMRTSPFHRFIGRLTSTRLSSLIFIVISFALKTCLIRTVYIYQEFLRHLKKYDYPH